MKFIYSENQTVKDRFFLYRYNENRFRIVKIKNCKMSGFENIDKENRNINTINDKEEIDRISLSRTKKNIKEICLCNNFTHFATLTINSKNCDRFSLTNCQDLLKEKIKKIKRKNKDFSYIFITEKHKDGAFHFHGLVKGIEKDFYINNNGFLSNSVFDEIGFNSFLKIKIDNINSYEKVCNYITKYISKECIKNEHNQIYICSRGLSRAEKYEIENINMNWSFENDFCQIKDINFLDKNIDKKDIFDFSNILEKNRGYLKNVANIINRTLT